MARLPRNGLAALLSLALAAPAAAESALRLPLPAEFGEISAGTFDEEGRRIGDARVRIDRLPNGDVSLVSEAGIEDGESTRVTAALRPVDGGDALQPLVEESRSLLADGQTLGKMRIDHAQRVLRCLPPEGEARELPLPGEDRVTLAPMNLLFLPLVRGETDVVAFQVAMCRGGPRIVDARAVLAPDTPMQRDGKRVVEVRTELDFGPVLSSVVRPFLPRLSLWFDGAGEGDWLAQRMPLFSKGPTVLVVRTGIAPDLLVLER